MSSSEIKVCRNEYGDKYLNVLNDTHFKNLSAKDIVSAIFLEKFNQRGKFNIIIGTDSGLLPKYLDLLPIKEKTRFLFIEPEIIYDAIQNLNSVDFDQEITITTPDKWEKIAYKMKLEEYIFSDNVSLFTSLAAAEGHIEDYSELYEEIREKIFAINYEVLSKTATQSFLRENLLNLADNIIPATKLKNIAKGKAIILGAGPSLTDHLEWIQKNQKKITIIAVSRICDLLLKNNITPDYVVSVDPDIANYNQSKALIKFDKSIFINSHHVNHKLLSQFCGLKFYRGNLFSWSSPLNEDNVDTIGPTVSHSALATAIEMGFSEIYLAGIDLCYLKSGDTHSDGQSADNLKTDDAFVETYSGDKLQTSHDFYIGINNLSKLSQLSQSPIFNLSPLAAKADGIDFCDHYPELPKKKWQLDKSKFTAINNSKQRIEKLIAEVEKNRIITRKIKKLCKKALDYNHQWRNFTNQQDIESKKIKMDLIEKKLLSPKFKSITDLAKQIAGQSYLRLSNLASKERTKDHEREWLEAYYHSIHDGADLINNFIDSSLRVLQTRIKETNIQKHYNAILMEWKENEIEGRSCIYKDKKDILDENQIHELQNICDKILAG